MTRTSVNLFAHAQAEMGVGEMSRRVISLLTASGIDLNIVPFEANAARKQHPLVYPVGPFKPDAHSISCVNADQLISLISLFGIYYSEEFTHTGLWCWELEDFPKSMSSAGKLLDEIWTISDFARNSIAASVTTPVKTVNVPVPVPSSRTELTRIDFGVPNDTFLVSTSFDFNSDIRRKNPEGAITAYKMAFPETHSSTLIVKSINGQNHPEEFERLKSAAENRQDIIFLDGYLNHYENQSLLEISDLYLSLHRAEGYGINMADSMARKTAVIATGYSGNLDFMDVESCVLVPHVKIPVAEYAGIPVNSYWADPDLEFAAFSIRMLANDPQALKKLGDAGFNKIVQSHSLQMSVKKFQKEFMNA